MFANVTLAFAEGGGDIIKPDGSLVFVLILFLLFVFVMNRLLFRPVGRVLDERQTLTEGAAHEARAALRRYENRLGEYEAAIRQARAESYKKLEQDRAAALERRQSLIEGAKQNAAGELAAAQTDIQRQVAAARVTLEDESKKIAGEISRIVLGRAVGGGSD